MKNWKPVRIEKDIFIFFFFFLLLNKNFKKENWGRRELKRWDCEVGPKGRWGKRERERKLQHQDSEGIVKDS